MSIMRKVLTAVAVVAATGIFSTAQASEGGAMVGLRLAMNYSYANLDWGNSVNDGGIGFEGGLACRFALQPGLFGISANVNYIYRAPIITSPLETVEHIVSVPLMLEINPFQLGGLESSVYEMIFLQFGVQFDYVVSYGEIQGRGDPITDDKLQWIERRPFDVGIIIGAVGYFNSNLSLDIRYTLGVTRYGDGYADGIDGSDSDSIIREAYVNQASLGLTYYF